MLHAPAAPMPPVILPLYLAPCAWAQSLMTGIPVSRLIAVSASMSQTLPHRCTASLRNTMSYASLASSSPIWTHLSRFGRSAFAV